MSLHLEDVSFSYRRARPVLHSISCAFEPGSLTAVLGPNGAGKSTLLRLALGVLRPSRGRVLLGERPVASIPEPLRAARIAYTPQRSSLAAPFSVARFVRLGRFALPSDEPAVLRAMQEADIADRAADRFDTLSAGQQQRAALARILAQSSGPSRPEDPRIILADEPFAALDPRHALAAMAALRARARDGLAVVVVLHDLTAALRFADRALLLDASGRVAALGPVRETLSPDNLRAVFEVPFRILSDGPDSAAIPCSASPDTIR